MEDIPNWIRALVPLLLLLCTVAFVLIKNHFVSRKEFKDFKHKHYQEHKELEKKIIKQGEDIVEIKTDVRHISNSLKNIEEVITKPLKRGRTN